jgi:hypothetical protein
MIKLFVCLECRKVFEEPIYWEEDRGECFGFPSYEHFLGSPCCGSDYTEAHRCDSCGEWITDNYIKVKYQRYCQDCYETFELGDED